MRIAILLLICSSSLAGQTLPHIAAIVSAADFKPGIAPGGYASIFGSNLSDAIHQASQPYPFILGPTQVAFCIPARLSAIDSFHCINVQLVYASPTQINFLVPTTFTEVPPIPGFAQTNAALVVSVNGVVDDGASSGNYSEQILGFGLPQPRIFFEGWDCFIDSRFQDANKNCGLTTAQGQTHQSARGAVTDQQGRLITSANPARLGQYYTVWMTGLWQPLSLGTSGNTALSMALTNIPEFQNGRLLPGDGFPDRITPSYLGQSTQYPGLYQLNFQLLGVPQNDGPGQIPCAQYNWEVSISIVQGLGAANLVQIPLMVHPSDLGCSE